MNIKLLDFKRLEHFPSGSGIEFYEDQMFLVGDDARDILVMNNNWKTRETINLFPGNTFRTPKDLKADFEATAIVYINRLPFLLILGSGSMETTRYKGTLMNIKTRALEEIDLTVFYNRLKQSGIAELNIEAACLLDDKVVLCNRGNKNQPENSLIITSSDFWKKQATADIIKIKLELEEKPEMAPGFSGLTYSYKNDWLILTASTEDTDNAIDDGAIGDSYLGIIENISRKIKRKRIKINEWFNFSEVNEKFSGFKIESVCIQADKEKKLKLHLVADNDKGESFLFKVRLKE